MSAHLPECPLHGESANWQSMAAGDCICDRLARAEQRGYDKGMRPGEPGRAWQTGYNAALDRARDAVAAIERWASYSPDGDVWSCWSSDPLSAIDALRATP